MADAERDGTGPGPLLMSASSLGLYLKCGEAYRRRYVENEIRPPSVAMVRGTGFHAGAEHDLRALAATGAHPSVPQVVDAAVAAFDAEVAAGGVEPSGDEKLVPLADAVGAGRDKVADLVASWRGTPEAGTGTPLADQVEPAKNAAGEPLIEASFELDVPVGDGPGVRLRGRLDVIDQRGFVVELKTWKRRRSEDELTGDVQGTLYHVAVERLTGAAPSSVQYHGVLDQKKPGVLKIDTHPGPADVRRLERYIGHVTAGIAAAIFPPATPGFWMCSERWCGFHPTCKYGGAP